MILCDTMWYYIPRLEIIKYITEAKLITKIIVHTELIISN
jgi:hypothetical protein